MQKMLKTLLYRYGHINIKEYLQNVFIYYKYLNFRVLDSMNDFDLIAFFGFAIKSYTDSEIPRS